jgi:hypothetical protein
MENAQIVAENAQIVREFNPLPVFVQPTMGLVVLRRNKF